MSSKPRNVAELMDSDAFQLWFDRLVKMQHDYHKKNFSRVPLPDFLALKGRKYVKIVKDQSVYAFVGIDGAIYKPASWQAPAKHARGNILDGSGGMDCCGPYSVAYLK